MGQSLALEKAAPSSRQHWKQVSTALSSACALAEDTWRSKYSKVSMDYDNVFGR